VPGDLFHLPDNADHQQTFEYNGSWQTWLKPLGISMVQFLCIGPGGGGGGGCTGATSTARGGGGAGCAGAVTCGLFPAAFLPDTLYVLAGAGGTSGPAGTLGGASLCSAVTHAPGSIVTMNQFLIAAGGGSGGGAGTASGGAGGGSTPGALTYTSGGTYSCPLGPLGNLTSYPPVAGGAGGNASGTAGGIPGSFTSIVTSGCGGGAASAANIDYGGGASYGLTSYGPNPPIPGGTALGGNGGNGYALRVPMFFLAGAGGGGYSAGTGGAGGNGAYGCGGGGGGGGITGGAGGTGGGGLCIVTCWLQRVTSMFPVHLTGPSPIRYRPVVCSDTGLPHWPPCPASLPGCCPPPPPRPRSPLGTRP